MPSITESSEDFASEVITIHAGPDGARVNLVVCPTIMEWDHEDHPNDWDQGPGHYKVEVAYLLVNNHGVIVNVHIKATDRADAIAQAKRMVEVEVY